MRGLIGVFNNSLAHHCKRGIRGLALRNNFDYPGHSNAVKHNNYAFYGITSFTSRTRRRHSVTRRLTRRTGLIGHTGHCLTCFRTCADAFTRIRILHSVCRRTIDRTGVINLYINAHPSYIPSTILSLLYRCGSRNCRI